MKDYTFDIFLSSFLLLLGSKIHIFIWLTNTISDISQVPQNSVFKTELILSSLANSDQKYFLFSVLKLS